MPVLLASVLLFGYGVYLRSRPGVDSITAFFDMQIQPAEDLNSLSYTGIVDLGFLIVAWIALWSFVKMIIRLQGKLPHMAVSPYLDIYLIAIFSFASICIAYATIDHGFGIGAAGMVAFGFSFLISSCFSRMVIYRNGLKREIVKVDNS